MRHSFCLFNTICLYVKTKQNIDIWRLDVALTYYDQICCFAMNIPLKNWQHHCTERFKRRWCLSIHLLKRRHSFSLTAGNWWVSRFRFWMLTVEKWNEKHIQTTQVAKMPPLHHWWHWIHRNQTVRTFSGELNTHWTFCQSFWKLTTNFQHFW